MRSRLLACLVFLVASPSLAAARPVDQIAALYGPEYALTISRNGEPIGQHILTFRQEPQAWQIAAASDMVIKLAIIPVFRFAYRSAETWEKDRLVALTAETNDDGERTVVKVEATGDGLDVSGTAGSWVAPRDVIATSHWRQPPTGPGVVVNTLTGKRNDVTITDRGEDSIVTGVGTLPARRLTYAGDLDVDTWYDAEGRWLGMRFKGRDGSVIDYACTRCGR